MIVVSWPVEFPSSEADAFRAVDVVSGVGCFGFSEREARRGVRLLLKEQAAEAAAAESAAEELFVLPFDSVEGFWE